MKISSFKKLRIESNGGVGGVFADVSAFDGGCSSGFMTVAYEIPSYPKEDWVKHKVEVRRKERQVALICYRYSDAEIPKWWRDAEVLYEWTQG